MHEPVLSDPVLLPGAGPQAGLCGEFLKDKEATHAHNCGAQLPGGHHCPSEGPQSLPAQVQLLCCSQGEAGGCSQPEITQAPSLPRLTSQFFELDVYHSDGTPLTSDQIFVQLEKIWNSSLQTNKEPVGILTSNHRNTWAKAYNTLIKGASRAGAFLCAK